MSIEQLDKDLKITTDENGIISYSHPDSTTVITSDYKVFNASNGRELKVYQNDKLNVGQISSKFKGKRGNYSFARLLALMAGYESTGYYRLIDFNKPLTLDNITTLKDHMKNSHGLVSKNSDEKLVITATSSVPEKLDGDFDICIGKEKIEKYFLDYVPCSDKLEYITEDGLLFTDRTKALLHQLSVDKGKELARKVLNAKAGYILAEEMYLSQVNYYEGKPLDYNFRTILENSEGVREIGDTTYLVDTEKSGVRQFEHKEDMEKWLKAKALVDMVVDYRYNVDRIANLIN